MLYFAYGSNMSLARLRQRVPSAERLGVYQLPGYQLRFHKASLDGSAKCDALYTGDASHQVLGVVYKMDPAERPVLDKAETLGTGYNAKQVVLHHVDGHSLEALIYYAIRIRDDVIPYDWYKHHVLVGAREVQLPMAYIKTIESVIAIPDPDRLRASREWAIHGAAG
ncbi:gamma-glutamylcyclotransferase family protein [Alkalimonas collagenimarina]|uniref:Gamma-glutamylcyclotransferase family protein n=1 Tax=Alkalimonas collagenimarina TaxID=400390 RepID=A0ABT9GWB5_9GAMM|nr:gamma-glutamylcyclotransferase family protein [Alkalimonas collagenimarina]MDP4535349.1 gamma-glutamylcyclotransferase family protein [Alkalimonas collagenimarina]